MIAKQLLQVLVLFVAVASICCQQRVGRSKRFRRLVPSNANLRNTQAKVRVKREGGQREVFFGFTGISEKTRKAPVMRALPTPKVEVHIVQHDDHHSRSHSGSHEHSHSGSHHHHHHKRKRSGSYEGSRQSGSVEKRNAPAQAAPAQKPNAQPQAAYAPQPQPVRAHEHIHMPHHPVMQPMYGNMPQQMPGNMMYGGGADAMGPYRPRAYPQMVAADPRMQYKRSIPAPGGVLSRNTRGANGPVDVATLYSHLDGNGDGQVTQQEFNKAVRSMLNRRRR